MTDYHHGVRVLEVDGGTRPIRTVSTAVIGLVATASDADAEAYPLDTPVLITNVQKAIGTAGKQGTLSKVLSAIAAQTNTFVVAVRVAEGETPEQTTSAVVGTTVDGKYTGIKALLSAETAFGVKPRILGAPGLENATTIAELVSVAQKLRGFVYASDLVSKTKEEVTTFRETFGQRELMILWPAFKRWDTESNKEDEIWASAIALGHRAKVDKTVGWHKTLSNMPVNGVTGITKDVFWSLQDPDTDAGYLNQKDVTTLINSKGLRFWGSRTCEGPSSLYPFENYTRTAQILADTIAEAHMWAVDQPMHPSLIKDMIEGINAKFRELKAQGLIINGQAWFDPDINTKEVLKSGKVYIDYDYTPVPPAENIVFQQRITDQYLADFAQQIQQS
ncbi:phage tail sheath protein [Pelistega sp. MC2]|uniref:phage tail sheath protein n=1 Tax=Pelistega sp. MC2 TaxID=1720297 RepID=UPI0008D8EE1A|nr:phage tail sheath protein [Pelistega sp. MC2]